MDDLYLQSVVLNICNFMAIYTFIILSLPIWSRHFCCCFAVATSGFLCFIMCSNLLLRVVSLFSICVGLVRYVCARISRYLLMFACLMLMLVNRWMNGLNDTFLCHTRVNNWINHAQILRVIYWRFFIKIIICFRLYYC